MKKSIKQYKDYDGNSVKVGDTIHQVTTSFGDIRLGVVTEIKKQGFYVWVKTEKSTKHKYWGKFTRKVQS